MYTIDFARHFCGRGRADRSKERFFRVENLMGFGTGHVPIGQDHYLKGTSHLYCNGSCNSTVPG